MQAREAVAHEAPADAEGVARGQLRRPDAGAVVDGRVADAQAEAGAEGEELGLELEAVGAQRQPPQGVHAEAPQPRAQVGDALAVEGGRAEGQQGVADAVHPRHGAGQDAAVAHHDVGVAAGEQRDDVRDGVGGVGAVAVEHDDIVALERRAGLAQGGALAVATVGQHGGA